MNNNKNHEKTLAQMTQMLEAKITHTIRTSKRTKNFKVYLDLLGVTYKQAVMLSDLVKMCERIASETDSSDFQITEEG